MKAVVFDFDGTLTLKQTTLWKQIWARLGYDVGKDSYYKSLFYKFMDKKITHKEWCELTCKAYKERGFNKDILNQLVGQMKLMDGVAELFKSLYDENIEIHIVSGNFVSVIKQVLGELAGFVTEIRGNEFVFDNYGEIAEIVGTKYDHEGKAVYITELCNQRGWAPSDIVFVGNSANDEWVHTSGAKTLCVNPDETDANNFTIWNNVLHTDNLQDIKNVLISF